MQYLKIKNATKKGYLKAYPGDGVDLRYPSSKLRRGRVQHKMAQTVQCDSGGGGVVVEETGIRSNGK